jgi:ATP-binding cassette subfamily B protein
MSGGLFVKFLGAIVELVIPWLLAYLIDTVAPANDVPMIVICGAVMLACAAAAFIFNIWANRTAAKVNRNVIRDLRHDLFAKICYLSCSRIDAFTTPSVISRLTSNTYDVNRMVGIMQRMGVRAPILLIGGIIITLTLDPMLTLVLVCTLPFIVLVVWLVSKKGIPRYTETYLAQDKMVRTVRENVTGIRIIKALSKTEHETARFEGVNNELSLKEKRAASTMALSNPLMNLLLNVGLVAVILVGAWRVNADLTEPGKIIAFMTYFTIILNALISITRLFVIYSKSSASAKRIFEVINAPDDITVTPSDKLETNDHIVFDGVSFSYLKKRNNLTDVSFSLKHGQTLGIIGDVGSGKSTIINLLMRFYDADSGAIYIDGENVRAIAPERLYNMFGVVFQNDIIFSASIAENIDFYKSGQEERRYRAAAAAQADGFIEEFGDGFLHKLAVKGADLSGGQKQRILLARAFAKNAPVLILDDSSSALDYKTDAAMRKAIDRDCAAATKVIVAQRVSSIKHADVILVLKDGAVAGRGTHGELMTTCPEYREIYKIQMGDIA